MNLEAARNKVVALGFSGMLKDAEARQLLFEIYRQVGDPITRTCMNCIQQRFNQLQAISLKNVKPMDQRKYHFVKGKSIRRGKTVYSNLNITDEKAEELMEEEPEYKKFFEINPKYAIAKVEDSADANDEEEKDEKAKLKAEIEELTGEKPKGNPGIENLKKKLEEAKSAKA